MPVEALQDEGPPLTTEPAPTKPPTTNPQPAKPLATQPTAAAPAAVAQPTTSATAASDVQPLSAKTNPLPPTVLGFRPSPPAAGPPTTTATPTSTQPVTGLGGDVGPTSAKTTPLPPTIFGNIPSPAQPAPAAKAPGPGDSPTDVSSSGGYGSRYYTYKKDAQAALKPGQKVGFTRGRGYYDYYPATPTPPKVTPARPAETPTIGPPGGSSGGTSVSPTTSAGGPDQDASGNRTLTSAAGSTPHPLLSLFHVVQQISIHGKYPHSKTLALAAARSIKTPEQWAIVLLVYMGLPVNEPNVQGLLDWQSSENSAFPDANNKGTGGQPGLSGYHNPINTGFLYQGKGPKTPNSHRPNGAAAAYPSWAVGIEATAYTLREPQYSAILKVLEDSEGPQALGRAVLSTPSFGTQQWSTAPNPPYVYSSPYEASTYTRT